MGLRMYYNRWFLKNWSEPTSIREYPDSAEYHILSPADANPLQDFSSWYCIPGGRRHLTRCVVLHVACVCVQCYHCCMCQLQDARWLCSFGAVYVCDPAHRYITKVAELQFQRCLAASGIVSLLLPIILTNNVVNNCEYFKRPHPVL